jgi:hypothetical protein
VSVKAGQNPTESLVLGSTRKFLVWYGCLIVHAHADHDEYRIVLLREPSTGGIAPPGATGNAVCVAWASEHALPSAAGV